MTISQKVTKYDVKGAVANVYVDPDEKHFKLYMPRDRRSGKLYDVNQLPEMLEVLFGTTWGGNSHPSENAPSGYDTPNGFG